MQQHILKQENTDSTLFYQFARICLRDNETDLLINTYRQTTETGQKDFTMSDVPVLKSLYEKEKIKPLTENTFYASYYTGRIIGKYHLDSVAPLGYFKQAIAAAENLNDVCLIAKGNYGLASYYMNIKHDVLKTNEYLEHIDEMLKKEHKNGIIDCDVDMYIAYFVLYYYLDENEKTIPYLNKGIEIVKKINKPQRLFDLYCRRSLCEGLLGWYNRAMITLDSAAQTTQNQPNQKQLLNIVQAARVNIFVETNRYDSALALSAGVEAKDLLDGRNDEYYDYMLNLIKMNIHFGQYDTAAKNIELYKSSLKGWNIQRWENFYEVEYLLSKAQNKPADALKYYEKYTMYDDSVHHQKQNFAVLADQIKYHTREKDEALKLQIAANELQSKNAKLIVSLAITACLLLVLALGYRVNKGLREKERLNSSFTKKLIQHTEREQNRLANDLHDGLGQELLLLKDGLTLEQNKGKAAIVANIIESVRDMARDLYPALLETVGLKTAIENQLNKIDNTEAIFISSDIDYEGKLGKETELQVFRIFQEAITNVLKYAQASSVYVALTEVQDSVKLVIKDNGKGFDYNEKINSPQSFGLQSMQRRAESINGILKINSSYNKGTEIVLTFKKNENTDS